MFLKKIDSLIEKKVWSRFYRSVAKFVETFKPGANSSGNLDSLLDTESWLEVPFFDNNE